MNGYFWAVVGFMILQWFAAFGRIYVRVFMVRNWGWDDWAMIATLLLATAFDAQAIAIVKITDLKSVTELLIYRQDDLFTGASMVLATDVTYIAGATMLKVALALLLLRVLLAKWQRITIYITLAVALIYGIFYFCLILFQCGNPAHFAYHVVTEGFCISKSLILGTSYAHAILNAMADCIFAILPVHFIYKANLNLRTKLSVGFILILGSVGSICTLIRIGWIHYLVSIIDTYWSSVQGICLMSSAELAIGVTCICLATYKPLCRRFLGLRTDYYYYYGNESENNYVTRPTSEASQMRDLPREANTASTDKTLQPSDWPLKSSAFQEQEIDSPQTPTDRSTFSDHTDVAPGGDWESDNSTQIIAPSAVLVPNRQAHWEGQRATSPPSQQYANSHARNTSSNRTYVSGRRSQNTSHDLNSVIEDDDRTASRASRQGTITPDAGLGLSAADTPTVSQEQLTALPKSPPRPSSRWRK